MLYEENLKLIENIFIAEYIKQEEIIECEKYLNKFEFFLRSRYPVKEVFKIVEHLKNKKPKFELYEDIKNFKLNNVEILDSYISYLDKKQRINLLDQYLEKIEYFSRKNPWHSYPLVNAILKISLKYDCFEDICKGKKKLKGFLIKNKKEFYKHICNYTGRFLEPFFKFKADYFLGEQNNLETPSSIFEQMAEKEPFYNIVELLLHSNKKDIDLFLKTYYTLTKKPISIEDLFKNIKDHHPFPIFDKNIFVFNSLKEIGIEYDIKTILTLNIDFYNLAFLKDEYLENELEILEHIGYQHIQQGIYNIPFSKEKKQTIINQNKTNLTKVYEKLNDFFNIYTLEEKKPIQNKSKINKIKIGF